MRTTMRSACSLYVLLITAVLAAAPVQAAPIDTVRLKFEAFNRHDADGIEGLYADAASLHSPDYPNLVGNKPIADTYRKLFDAIPDAQDTVEVLESSAKHIYVQFVLTGHWNGAVDKPIKVRIISVYAIESGRIVADSTYYDRKAP